MKIAIIGGSGLYTLLQNPDKLEQTTKFGRPSSSISLGKLASKEVAFIPRHGGNHTIPPHKVPYKANIDALANLGVERIISTSAVGSLTKEYKPGDIVLLDQFVNMTHSRDDTFYDESRVVHVSTADPYCPQLRQIASGQAKELGISCHNTGTVVVINGPRFSTRAESRFFSKQGFHAIGMTQYPEAALARERQICYLGIGVITDYDVGLEQDAKPVSFEEVGAKFAENIKTVRTLIEKTVEALPEQRSCTCANSLEGAVVKA